MQRLTHPMAMRVPAELPVYSTISKLLMAGVLADAGEVGTAPMRYGRMTLAIFGMLPEIG